MVNSVQFPRRSETFHVAEINIFQFLYCDTLKTAHRKLFFQMHVSFGRFRRNIHSSRNVYAGRWHAVRYQIWVRMLEITGFPTTLWVE